MDATKCSVPKGRDVLAPISSSADNIVPRPSNGAPKKPPASSPSKVESHPNPPLGHFAEQTSARPPSGDAKMHISDSSARNADQLAWELLQEVQVTIRDKIDGHLPNDPPELSSWGEAREALLALNNHTASSSVDLGKEESSAPSSSSKPRGAFTKLLDMAVKALGHSFSVSTLTIEEREDQDLLQTFACDLIYILCSPGKLDKADILPLADNAMKDLLHVLALQNGENGSKACCCSCLEDAFYAIGALAVVMGGDFEKYMPELQPRLVAFLRNVPGENYPSNFVGAANAVSVVARSIAGKIQPYCDEIISALLQSLTSNEMLANGGRIAGVPAALDALGIIAVAIRDAFEPYLPQSMRAILHTTSRTLSFEEDDNDNGEAASGAYAQDLAVAVLNAYTCIIKGLSEEDRAELIDPHAGDIFGVLDLLFVKTAPDKQQLVNKAAELTQ